MRKLDKRTIEERDSIAEEEEQGEVNRVTAREPYDFAGSGKWSCSAAFLAFAARAFFKLAMSAALRAADIFLLGFSAGFWASSFAARKTCHRFRVASEIRFLAAALILRFFGATPSVTVSDRLPS